MKAESVKILVEKLQSNYEFVSDNNGKPFIKIDNNGAIAYKPFKGNINKIIAKTTMEMKYYGELPRQFSAILEGIAEGNPDNSKELNHPEKNINSDELSFEDIVEGINNKCFIYTDMDLKIPFIIYNNKCLGFVDNMGSLITSYIYEQYKIPTKNKSDIYDILLRRAEENIIKTFIRSANVENNQHYYKLNNDSVVKINKDGWDIVNHDANIIFRPSDLTIDQVEPIHCDDRLFDLLFDIRITKHEKILLMGALVAGMINNISHPVLNILGKTGVGKTDLGCYVVNILDPTGVRALASYSSDKEFQLALSNSICYGLDNLSSISQETSDIICMYSTGGGMDIRTLYKTRTMEHIIYAGTLLTTSIDDTFKQPDILNRTIQLNLWSSPIRLNYNGGDFKYDLNYIPHILGSIFDCLVYYLNNKDQYKNCQSPIRLVDYYYVTLLTAIKNGFTVDDVNDAFKMNVNKTANQVLDKSIIGMWIVENITSDNSFYGKTQELLDMLKRDNGKSHYSNISTLGKHLHKIRADLFNSGYLYSGRNKEDDNKITIIKL